MKITRITSHVLQYEMPEFLGYSQQYCDTRSAHLVDVQTDKGVTDWGECFGPKNVATANKTIVEQVIQPMGLGLVPLDRDVIWHKVFGLLRDHGQSGMPVQALSGVDIVLWGFAGRAANLPVDKLAGRPADKASEAKEMGFAPTKTKTGFGPCPDVKLCEAVRRGLGENFRFMVDADQGHVAIPDKPGIGVEPDPEIVAHFKIAA